MMVIKENFKPKCEHISSLAYILPRIPTQWTTHSYVGMRVMYLLPHSATS